jgi:hypothetical protein
MDNWHLHLSKMISDLDKIVKPYNNKLEFSKKINSSLMNEKLWLTQNKIINKSITHNLWANKFSNTAFIKNYDTFLNDSTIQKITSLENGLNNYKFLTLLNYSESINILFQKSIAYDLNNTSNKTETIYDIEQVLEEANQVISIITNSAEDSFKIINTFLRKIFASKKLKTLTYTFIVDLIMQILISQIMQPTTNQVTNISQTQNITIQTVNNISNDCNIYINSIKKEIKTRPRNDSKLITIIPIGTELNLIKKNKKWALFTFINNYGIYSIGWATMDGIDE